MTWLTNVVKAYRDLKQPYVAIGVIFITAVVIYMLSHHGLGVERASSLFAMAISAAFVSKASTSMQSVVWHAKRNKNPPTSRASCMSGLRTFYTYVDLDRPSAIHTHGTS